MLNRYNALLLKRYPLLWNTKTLYVIPALLLINFAFFMYGYADGKINFWETDDNYSYDSTAGVLLFAVLLGVFSMILWLAFYFRNNGFKALYPKSAFSLFSEWFLVLISCFLMCSSFSAYTLGKDVRHRSYFSLKDATRRTETLSMASFFYDGSFDFQPYKKVLNKIGDTISVPDYSFPYEGRRYSTTSLLNKDIEDYTIMKASDSVLKVRIRKWLINNQRDSVKATLARFLDIAKEHGLRGNVDAEKWTSLVYHYPDFNKFVTIGKEERADIVESSGTKIDTTNQYMILKNGKYIIRNKYHVPAAELSHAYNIISEGYSSPDFDFNNIIILAYFSFGLSVLLFSFRVTSARQWLLTLITIFVLGLLVGFSSLFRTVELPVWVLFALHLMVYGYFFFIVSKGESKRLSPVALNLVLWTLPGLLFTLYAVFLKVLTALNGYDDYNSTVEMPRSKVFPITSMLEDAWPLVSVLSLLAAFLVMPFFCRSIRRWKALAES